MTFQPHRLEFTVGMVFAMALTILVVMMIFRPELNSAGTGLRPLILGSVAHPMPAFRQLQRRRLEIRFRFTFGLE